MYVKQISVCDFFKQWAETVVSSCFSYSSASALSLTFDETIHKSYVQFI